MPDFTIEPLTGNLPNAKIILKGRSVTLHSMAPFKEAERTFAQFNPSLGTVLIAGAGLCYGAEYLLKNTNYKVILYEHTPEILDYARGVRDLKPVLYHPRLKLFTGDFQQVLDYLQEAGIRELNFYLHRPYFNLFPEVYSTIEGLLIAYLSRRLLNQATLQRFQKVWLKNIVRNSPHYFNLPGIVDLRHNLAGKPAVIVGAGPSLGKNIDVLREIQESITIISTDTALSMLASAGIKADFVVSVDPQDKNALYLAYSAKREAWLILDAAASDLAFRSYSAEKTVLCDTIFPLYELMKPFWGDKGGLLAGGSVSTTAFDFARFLGANPIVLVGQDMAYSQRHTHYQGSALEEFLYYRIDRLKTYEDYNSRMLLFSDKIEIQGSQGDKVLSDRKFVTFLEWFKREIRNTSVPVINATEGGAFMQGARHLTLRETVLQFHINTRLNKKITTEFTPRDGRDFSNFLANVLKEIENLIPAAAKAVMAFGNSSAGNQWIRELDIFDSAFRKSLESGSAVARFLEFTMQDAIEEIMLEENQKISKEVLRKWSDFYQKAYHGLLFIKRVLQKRK